jgi:hypothetical protein
MSLLVSDDIGTEVKAYISPSSLIKAKDAWQIMSCPYLSLLSAYLGKVQGRGCKGGRSRAKNP